jgi:uncharacterized LabA/DUF88 family protein
LPQSQERLNIAVFIDFDNIEIGVKSTLGQQFDVGTILDAIKERGEVVTKIAYADWTRAGEYSRSLTQHAIRLVQRNLTPGGDKNGADINLALDALEMAFTHPHINAYVIVGGDSDFLSLVEKLKQYDKKVFVVGGRAFTSVILQRNCHEFIAYENLHGVRKTASKSGRPMPAAAASSPIAQAIPIVRRALKILADREVSPQTGLLKSTLLQLDSTFSERNYGAGSFLDFVEKLSQAGVVQLKHSGRSVMVELNEHFDEGAAKSAPVVEGAASEDGTPEEVSISAASPPGPAVPAHPTHQTHQPNPTSLPQIGSQADAVRMVAEILRNATSARWPMYLRNVKQILRQHREGQNGAGPGEGGGFDERRYGFGGLIDLLRACQRDGIVRLERDRRGGLRVFQGAALQRAGAPAAEASRSASLVTETAPGSAIEAREADETETVDFEPMPTVDPTAVLLGTAKRKRGSRTTPRPPAPVAAAPKKAAPRGTRKTAARRPARAKKASDANVVPE